MASNSRSLLIIGGSGSRKSTFFLNLINHQPYYDKIHLYAKNPFEPKHQLAINKRQEIDVKHL